MKRSPAGLGSPKARALRLAHPVATWQTWHRVSPAAGPLFGLLLVGGADGCCPALRAVNPRPDTGSLHPTGPRFGSARHGATPRGPWRWPRAWCMWGQTITRFMRGTPRTEPRSGATGPVEQSNPLRWWSRRSCTQCSLLGHNLLNTPFNPGAYGRFLSPNELLGVSTGPPVLPESPTSIRGFLSGLGARVALLRTKLSSKSNTWLIRATLRRRSRKSPSTTWMDYWVGRHSHSLQQVVVREHASVYSPTRHQRDYFYSRLTARFGHYGRSVKIQVPSACRQ